jgi:hypothetical protein
MIPKGAPFKLWCNQHLPAMLADPATHLMPIEAMPI